MKIALLLPGYLDSPDYLHLVIFEKRLKELGYTTERLDPCNLWETGNTANYSITNYLKQIKDRISFYKSQNPEEVVLLGHSLGAFVSIIAGSKMSEVTKIISLCPPPNSINSSRKWINGKLRISMRDLPSDTSEFRKFEVTSSFVDDWSKYSVLEEVKYIHKPLMIFIGLDDVVVPPALSEEIVNNANSPYVVRQENIGHNFRHSEVECNLVMEHIEKFLQL